MCTTGLCYSVICQRFGQLHGQLLPFVAVATTDSADSVYQTSLGSSAVITKRMDYSNGLGLKIFLKSHYAARCVLTGERPAQTPTMTFSWDFRFALEKSPGIQELIQILFGDISALIERAARRCLVGWIVSAGQYPPDNIHIRGMIEHGRQILKRRICNKFRVYINKRF